LRKCADQPTYRELGKIAYRAQNWLSQTANGRQLPGEDRVRDYVRAIQEYAAPRDIDLNQEMRAFAAEFDVDPDADVVEQALIIRRRIELRAVAPPEPVSPVPPSLAEALTVDDLVRSLNELVARLDSVPEYVRGAEAQDMLARRRPLTPEGYDRILEACGADQKEWAEAWSRVAPPPGPNGADVALAAEPTGRFRRFGQAVRAIFRRPDR
jgi:hypothetical protein